jgi:hypothetical protein
MSSLLDEPEAALDVDLPTCGECRYLPDGGGQCTHPTWAGWGDSDGDEPGCGEFTARGKS